MFVAPGNRLASDSPFSLGEPDSVLSFDALGVKLKLRVPRALLSQLAWPIVPGAEVANGEPPDAVFSVRDDCSAEGVTRYEIAENGAVLGAVNGLEAAASAVESWAQLTVATLAKEVVFVHAGVVRWKDQAIVVPGRSLSGKSTLALSFVERGADYYSDEYAIFDSEGRIHPYWRFPKLRIASDRNVARSLLAGTLRGAPPRPIPLGWVLITRYEAESRWLPRQLSCGRTLLGLLDNTVPLRCRPEQSVSYLARAVKNAQGFDGMRGEAGDFADQVLAAL